MVTRNDMLKVVSTLAIGLYAVNPAMAHNGELHGRPEEAAQPEAIEAETTDTDISVSDTQPSLAESAVEVSPTVSTAAPINQFSIGFEEILFSAVLIFPWLLITLRKQLHSKPRL